MIYPLHNRPEKLFSITLSIRKSIFSFCLLFLSFAAISQQTGEFRSVASGNWSATNTWQVYNGASWVAATNYPLQSANCPKVTILAAHTVTLASTQNAFVLSMLEIYGKLFVTGGDRLLNVVEVKVYPPTGQILLNGNVSLTIPANSFISYPNGYNGVSGTGPPCSNNTALFIGNVKYSACTGGGNVCVTFDDLNNAGGTVHLEPDIELVLSGDLGAGNYSCLQNFPIKITVKGVVTGSPVTIALSGVAPGGQTISFSPSTFGPIDTATHGVIVVQTNVQTSAPGTYTINGLVTATLTTISCNTSTSIQSSNTASKNIVVRPPFNLNVVAPGNVCGGDIPAIALTNNGAETVAVAYMLGATNTSVNVASGATVNVSVPTNQPSVAYDIISYKYTNLPACTVDPDIQGSVVFNAPSSLASDGDTKTQNVLLNPVITASQACRLMAKVENTTVTNVEAKAFVASGPVVYSGRPMLGRRISLRPTGTTGSALITLYVKQQEFIDFNNSPINNIDLPYSGNDHEGYASNIRVIKFDEANFDNTTGLPTGNVQATATEIIPTSVSYNVSKDWWEIKVPVSSFSLFVVSNPTFVLLPLKLLSFDAQLSGKRTAALSWKTSEERNVKAFDVEVSKDGTDFSKVGEVLANNSVAGGNYHFNTAMPGKLGYFRLKMKDNNGAFSYSAIKALKTDDLIINSYPNPVKDQLVVDLTGYPAGTLRIVDMNGRTISSAKTVDGINRINTSGLGTGMYLLQVNVGLETEMIKFNKVQR